MAKSKTRSKQFVDKNPVEAFQDIGSSVVKSVASDLGKSIFSDAWNQFIGVDKNEQGKDQKLKGDLSEGEELSLAALKKREKEEEKKLKLLDIAPGIDYKREILQGEKRTTEENQKELQVKIQEILIELRRLTAASKELQVEFREVTVEQRVVKPGKYHESFFGWILSLIRQARIRVEDSQAWLAAFKSKHAKREYWAMFKKHGTTFGLSNERVVATQVG